MAHLTTTQIEAGMAHVLEAPSQVGSVDLIVRRPAVEGREVLGTGELSVAEGLVGDNWSARTSSRNPGGGAHPEMQLNVMSSRFVDLIAADPERRALAGDQLYVDLDLSEANLAAGTQLTIGDAAVIEVTAEPHTGCDKFTRRFGLDAHRFVNSGHGRALRLRGLNAKVITPGLISVGDRIVKLDD
jgi:MOSC domain-containing protein YiiM